jgi:hypothetical protein
MTLPCDCDLIRVGVCGFVLELALSQAVSVVRSVSRMRAGWLLPPASDRVEFQEPNAPCEHRMMVLVQLYAFLLFRQSRECQNIRVGALIEAYRGQSKSTNMLVYVVKIST